MTHKTAPVNGEIPLLFLCNHWMQFAGPLGLILTAGFLYVVCSAVSLVLMSLNHAVSMTALIAGHALLLLFHHAAFYQIFSLSTSRTLITNKRILGSAQRLWLSDETTDVPLWKIRSMEIAKKGFLQHVFNYGSIIINRGELPGIRLIPQPDAAHARIVSQLQQLQVNASTAALSEAPLPV